LSPSKARGPPVAAMARLPRPPLPLMKFAAPRSIVCDRIAGTSGSPLPPQPRSFNRALRSLSVRRPPQACTCGFILPRALRLLQSPATDDLPPLARERLPWGFFPSSRPEPAASTDRPRSHPRAWRSVLGVSHALDGLLRHRPCGFVSPRSHVQGSPSRGLFLSAEPYRVSPAESCPLAVGRSHLRFDPCRRPRPRLQGLAPRAECGVDKDRLKPSSIRAPPGLPHPPPGSHSSHRGDTFMSPPPTTLIAMSPPQPILGVSPVQGTVCLVTRPPTRTRFPTWAPSLLSQEEFEVTRRAPPHPF